MEDIGSTMMWMAVLELLAAGVFVFVIWRLFQRRKPPTRRPPPEKQPDPPDDEQK